MIIFSRAIQVFSIAFGIAALAVVFWILGILAKPGTGSLPFWTGVGVGIEAFFTGIGPLLREAFTGLANLIKAL